MKSDTVWNRAFVQLITFELISQLGIALVNPITSNYAVAMGASVAVAGFLAGLNPLTSLIVRPFGGFFIGLARRKTLVLIASLIFAASSLTCVLFPMLATLGASRILLGVAYVVKSAIVVAVAATLVPRSCVGQGVAMVGLANVVANAIGPIISSYVGLSFGYRTDFVLSVALFALSLILLATLKIPESASDAQPKESISEKIAHMRNKGIRAFVYFKAIPFAILGFFTSYVYGTITMMLLLVGEERNIPEISLFFLVYAITSCVARPFASKLNDRYGLSIVLYPEAIIMCVACLVLAFAQSIEMFVVGAVLMALGQGCLFPSLQAESVRGVSDEDSSLAANTYFFGPDLGMGGGPLVSGIVMQAFGTAAMFLVCFGLGIALIAFYYFYDKLRKREAGTEA